jgi:hypothetical protein
MKKSELRDKIKYRPNENKIIFGNNGSEIHLAGTEKGNAEKVRGVSADLCLVDEAGFCDDLDYIIKNILFPTITRGTGSKGKKLSWLVHHLEVMTMILLNTCVHTT